MEQPALWGAIATIVVATITIIMWVAKIAKSFGLVESAAQHALAVAQEAKKTMNDLMVSLQAISAAHNLFQVQVARDYIDSEKLRELEIRLNTGRKEMLDEIRADTREMRDDLKNMRESINALVVTGRARRKV